MPKLTMTIELSDEQYRNAISTPVDERQERIAAIFATAPNRPEHPPTQADLEAIGRGLKAVEDGDERDADEVLDEIEKRFEWTK